ncbi:MAG: hypothetical protein ACFFHD_15260 [Promethearchaeota archaeon]
MYCYYCKYWKQHREPDNKWGYCENSDILLGIYCLNGCVNHKIETHRDFGYNNYKGEQNNVRL